LALAVDREYHLVAGALAMQLAEKIAQSLLPAAIDDNYAITQLQAGGARVIVAPHNGRPRTAQVTGCPGIDAACREWRRGCK
jgi:hypothetical protein